MFYLQPSVHFQEKEIAILIDELNGAGVVVPNGPSSFDGSFAHGLFDTVRQCWRWGFFDEFLVATLGRAVARRDPHHVAVFVAHQLHLDVTRPSEVALDIDFVAAEKSLRLALGRIHRFGH